MGAAATTSTAVGAGGAGDVEPDCEWVGILEQPDLDSDLIERRLARSRRTVARPPTFTDALQETSRSASRR